MNCANCNNETKNPKFCSLSCSASYNNKRTPKRQRTGLCVVCSKSISSQKKHCQDCKLSDPSIKDLMYKKGNRCNVHGSIRGRARTIAKKLKMDKCFRCGYDKHVEIAHIKPISEFSENVKVSDVNAQSNLCPLCPNCHWEFDNGLIKL